MIWIKNTPQSTLGHSSTFYSSFMIQNNFFIDIIRGKYHYQIFLL